MNEDNHLLLPYCPYCGEYKGVGVCREESCPGQKSENLSSFVGRGASGPINDRRGKCILCGETAVCSCGMCYGSYCQIHSKGRNSEVLDSMDQRLGTCSLCGRIVCENCWILDKRGKIVCLQHLEKK